MNPISNNAGAYSRPQLRALAPSPSPHLAPQTQTGHQIPYTTPIQMVPNDILSFEMRNYVKQVLRTVPFNSCAECYDGLVKTGGNVEKTILLLNDPKRIEGRTRAQQEDALRANQLVEPQIKIDTLGLKKQYPDIALQDCYLALRIVEGNIQKAAQDLGKRK